MQVGINSNIHHQAKVLHVQTEDSGYEHGHIITHIFLAGGIIASEKAEYASDCDEKTIQELIKTQHQKMIHALKAGHFDKKLLLNRARRPHGEIPLARKGTKKASPNSSTHKSTLELNPQDSSPKMPPRQSEVKDGPGIILESQGIWALPEFHRKSRDLRSKQESANQALSDEEGSS